MASAKLVLFAASVMIGASTQVEAQASRFYIVAQSGRPVEVGQYGALNPDCSSIGRVTINLLEAPEGGEVRIGVERRYLSFPLTNPRSACNRRKVSASFLSYQSRPGFVGRDAS